MNDTLSSALEILRGNKGANGAERCVYWMFIRQCCKILVFSLNRERRLSNSIVNNYSCALKALGQLYLCIQSSDETSNYGKRAQVIYSECSSAFLLWAQELVSVFETWKKNFHEWKITYDDILQFFKTDVFKSTAAALNVQISEQVVKDAQDRFKNYYLMLRDILLPKVPQSSDDTRYVLHVI